MIVSNQRVRAFVTRTIFKLAAVVLSAVVFWTTGQSQAQADTGARVKMVRTLPASGVLAPELDRTSANDPPSRGPGWVWWGDVRTGPECVGAKQYLQDTGLYSVVTHEVVIMHDGGGNAYHVYRIWAKRRS